MNSHVIRIHFKPILKHSEPMILYCTFYYLIYLKIFHASLLNNWHLIFNLIPRENFFFYNFVYVYFFFFYTTLTIANDIHSNESSILSLNKSFQAKI